MSLHSDLNECQHFAASLDPDDGIWVPATNGHDPHPSELKPNLAALVLFKDTLFRNARQDGFVSLRTFLDNGIEGPPVQIRPYRLDDYQFNDLMLIEAENAATWYVPAVFAPPVCTFKNHHNAKTDNIHEGQRIETLEEDAEIDLGEALARLREAAATAGLAPVKAPGGASSDRHEASHSSMVPHALSVIPNGTDPKAHDWEYWNVVGMTVWASDNGEAGRLAFHEWSAKSPKYNKDTTEKRWQHYFTSPPNRLGFGSLVWRAREADPTWQYGDGFAIDTEFFGQLLREYAEPDDGPKMELADQPAMELAEEEAEVTTSGGTDAAATDDASPPAAPPPSPKAKPKPLPRWVSAMLSIQTVFSGKTFTDKDTGAVYGPYKDRGALLTAFLIRCVKEGIPDKVIVSVLTGDERLKDSNGALHTHCRETMTCRGDLEQLIALTKENAGVVASDKPDAAAADDASPDATDDADAEPGPSQEDAEGSSPPLWFFVMLGISNTNHDVVTINDDVPGETFGPYKTREDLLTAFLIRCAKEGVADELVIKVLLSEQVAEQIYKENHSTPGAIHAWCSKKKLSRSDLEQRIALAKEEVALDASGGDASAPLSPPLDELVAKTIKDPGAPFEKDNLNALLELRRKNRPSFEALWVQLKKAKCRVGELDRALGPSPKPKLKLVVKPGQPDWRETAENGSPVPSMENAKRAIITLGVECAYDAFHNKLLVGYQADPTRHIIDRSELVTDHGIMGLRTKLSDAYDFDLTERHVRDAVVSIALDHRFDPVLDMLAEAEANWDGVARLDRVAADYFACEDTPLNAACFRKHLIAGVARVRFPGCKHDEIVVLESKVEGWNKSAALRLLAMDDRNFSDAKIIGKDSREVQEQLAGVWIHENSEMAGMRKVEIEAVKAYARRQSDKARPAYGHFLEDQPRRSIDFGTTNDEEYLLSQTGNRCFWGMKLVARIDLEKLRADRLQIWGEAAHYESQEEALTIDESLWPDATAAQEDRRVRHLWEDILARLTPVPARNSGSATYFVESGTQILHSGVYNGLDCELVATSSIVEHALRIPAGQLNNSHSMTLKNVMRALGWERPMGGNITIEGKRMKGYYRVREA